MAPPRRTRSFEDEGDMPKKAVLSAESLEDHAELAATPAAPSTTGAAPAQPTPARARRVRSFEGHEAGPPSAAEQSPGRAARSGKGADQAEEQVRLSGYVTRTIFKSDDGVFRVLGISPRQNTSPKDIVTINDPNFAPNNGDKVEFIGRWTERGGKRQLMATVGHVSVDRTNSGVRRWLKSDVAGVGDAAIQRLEDYFGSSLVQHIDNASNLVRAGISQKQAVDIVTAWTGNEYHNELMTELMGYGLPSKVSSTIVKAYGAGIRHIIATNPWMLASFDGVGFPTTDAIASMKGIPVDSPSRILAGLHWTLKSETEGQGHVGLPASLLVDRAAKLLKLRPSLVSPHLEDLVASERVVRDDTTGMMYPPELHEAESYVAERLGKMAALPDLMSTDDARELASRAARINGMKLHPLQMEAVVMALTKPVCVITGGPGTGKSTVQKIVVDSLRLAEFDLSLACPTGKAAKRLSSTAGVDASTIHRQLIYARDGDGEPHFIHNENNPLEASRLITDEMSMVTLMLAYHQLKAVPQGAGVIMVGDVRQLPSVGAGQVLRDCIDSGVIPVTRLTQTFRTANDSGISVVASRIDRGEYPVVEGELLRGFKMIEADDSGIVYEVRRLLTEVLPEKGYSIRDDVAVLAAVKESDLGVKRMNRIVKSSVNPAWNDDRTRDIGEVSVSVGDPMMQNTNCYTKNITNGELGVIETFRTSEAANGKGESLVSVRFDDGAFTYGKKEQAQIDLSWANTVHKYQGSERPVVVVLLPKSHQFSLTRANIYTALTRAKVEAYFVGSPSVLREALRKTDAELRYTGLATRLREAYSREVNISLADLPKPEVSNVVEGPVTAPPVKGRISLTRRA